MTFGNAALGAVAIHLPGDSGCRIEIRDIRIEGLNEREVVENALQILRDITSVPISALRTQVIDVCHPQIVEPR